MASMWSRARRAAEVKKRLPIMPVRTWGAPAKRGGGHFADVTHEHCWRLMLTRLSRKDAKAKDMARRDRCVSIIFPPMRQHVGEVPARI